MTAELFADVAPALVSVAAAAAAAAIWFRSRARERKARAFFAGYAAERRYNVLEALHEGLYIVDSNLRVTHMNEEAERLLHRSAGSVIGHDLDKMVDPLGSELIPDILAAQRSRVAIEKIHAFPDLQLWVEVRILPAPDELLISLRDVSAQTIAESQMHANAHRLELVANNVDAVLWTVGRDGRFTALSGGALDDLALSAGALVGEPCTALIDETVLRDVLGGRHARVETAHGDHWLRHHVEPLADRDHNIIGAVGVSIDITELKRTQRQLFEAAHSDRLTGLPNRFSLDQCLQQAIAKSRLEGRAFALLFLDLDRFKTINDTMGHGAGDEVLRQVGGRLQRCLRGADFIARPGGDEFVIILPGIAGVADIEMLSQRLIAELSSPVQLPDRDVYVAISIGAAVFPDHGLDADALTAHADAAMYRAKALGGSGLTIYEASMQAADSERFALEADLRHALERGELEVEYQPIVDLKTDLIIGCEALTRWRHPTRGRIPPAVFIPIAEDSSLIVDIDRWVLQQACLAASAFRAEIPDFRVAVNLSARDLRESDLCATVATALAQHEIPARCLILEITETTALDDAALQPLERLRDLGVQIAMDDFGIGYSSLAHLKRLPINTLKIDRTFVRDVTQDASDRAIVVSIVNVAKAFGLRVVAEGIETLEQADLIASLGCDDGQGFRFGESQTFEAFMALLQTPRRRKLHLVALTG